MNHCLVVDNMLDKDQGIMRVSLAMYTKEPWHHIVRFLIVYPTTYLPTINVTIIYH